MDFPWISDEFPYNSGQLRQAQYINTLGLYDPNMQENSPWNIWNLLRRWLMDVDGSLVFLKWMVNSKFQTGILPGIYQEKFGFSTGVLDATQRGLVDDGTF